jgi:nitrite reductase/ring-hydroxylating ferredoxin subunit
MPATNDDTNANAGASCGDCSLHAALSTPAAMERREFFRVAGLALASLGLFGLGARDAEAMPVRNIAPLAGRGGSRPEEKHYPFPAADGVSIDKDSSVIVARAGGKVYAFSLACPHQNTALRWDDSDHEFICPKHKSHYRADGTFIEGRSTRAMDRLAVRRAGAELIVDIDKLYQEDDNLAEWTAAFVTV